MARVRTRLGNIGYCEAGGGDATPILFLHGVGSNKSVWRGQLAFFGAARRSIAFDYPGYGESNPGPPQSNHDGFADAILAGMDALEVETAHVCGLSLGGVVAIALYARAPGRCRSLIIADSFARHPQGRAIYDRAIELSSSMPMRSLAEQRAPLLLAPGTSPPVRDEVIETMGAIDPAAYRIASGAVWLAEQNARAAAIQVPTLILAGALDPVTPPELSRELYELVPGSRLEIIDDASHLTNLDQPAVFNRLVDRFILDVEAKA